MALKTFMRVYIINLCSQVLPVVSEVCASSVGPVTLDCDYGCCGNDSDECCESPYWNWYVIVGVVFASVVGVSMLVAFIICVCAHCHKQNKTGVQPQRILSTGSANRVGVRQTAPPRQAMPIAPSIELATFREPYYQGPYKHRGYTNPFAYGDPSAVPPPYDFHYDTAPPSYEELAPTAPRRP